MNVSRKPTVLHSIGHSNHPLSRFLELLRMHSIEAIADVRSTPYSRWNPQYSQRALKQALKDRGFTYVFLGTELGARRSEPECYLNGRVDYDRVARTDAFQTGIRRLIEGATKMNVAMMCAEKDPLSCHRTILIGRHVAMEVDELFHIHADGRLESQAQAEQRLLAETGLQNEDLFATLEDRVNLAMRQRGERIAYQVPTSRG